MRIRKSKSFSVGIRVGFLTIFTLFLAFFMTFTVQALSERRLRVFSTNNILFYEPDDNDCLSSVSFNGDEVTWAELDALGNDTHARLKLLVERYGEFAMDLQRHYGVPWEMPFAMMVRESSVGTEPNEKYPNMLSKKVNDFNMMGLTYNSWFGKDDHYDDPAHAPNKVEVCLPGQSCQTNEFSNYQTISKMLLGWAVYHVRSGKYAENIVGLASLSAVNYEDNLYDAMKSMMKRYCSDDSKPDGDCYTNYLYEYIRGDGGDFPEIIEVINEKGWKNSGELAKAENLQPGGFATEKWGWEFDLASNSPSFDIRENIWKEYGDAGISSEGKSGFVSTKSTFAQSGTSVSTRGATLRTPSHDWLDNAGLEGYIKNEINLNGSNGRIIDPNAVENGKYLDYASDAGNGSGLPGFIILHLTSASNFGAHSWTNYTSTTNEGVEIYVPPHFTIDVKERKVYQHFPLSHPSAAVKSRDDTPDGSIFKSDQYGIQIEIVGHGGEPYCMHWSCTSEHDYRNFTDEDWEYVAELMMAISDETGIPLTSSVRWWTEPDSTLSVKMNTEDIKKYIGVLGHEHINGKWDPLNAWSYIEQALSRLGYSYSSTAFSVCGTPHSGSCQLLDNPNDGGCTTDGYTYYWQGGPSWANKSIRSDCGSTVMNSGCGYAALAMVITALQGQKVTPDEIVEVAKSVTPTAYMSCTYTDSGAYVPGGSYGEMPLNVLKKNDFGISYEYHHDIFGFDVKNLNEILTKNGNGNTMLMFTVGSGELAYMGHWIVIRGVSDSGKWKIFTSSDFYNDGVSCNLSTMQGCRTTDVNDKEIEPQHIVDAKIAHGRGYWYVFTKK